MALPWEILIFLTLFATFTSVISAVTGMGGGIVLLSAMTFILPFNVIVPLHGAVQLISNTTRSWLLIRYVKKKMFWPFLVGAPFGTVLAVYFIKSLESRVVPFALISLMIFYTIFRPKKLPPLKIKNPYFVIVGLIAGMFGVLVGATGPFLAAFFVRDDLHKEEIVATKAAMQLFIHLLKVPAFFYLGFPYKDYWFAILILTFAAILGTKIGVNVLKKINERIFSLIFRTLLFIAGLRLIYKILQELSVIS